MSISFPQQKIKRNLPTSIPRDVLHMILSETTTLPTSQATGQTVEATANGMSTPTIVAVLNTKGSVTTTPQPKVQLLLPDSHTMKVTTTATTMVTSRHDLFAFGHPVSVFM